MTAALTALLSGKGAGSAWVAPVMKFGPAWALVAYLIYSLTTGMSGDVRAARAEHQDLAFYLRQICIGINRDTPNAWQQCQPPHDK